MGKHKKDKKDKKDRKRSREYDSPFTDDRDDKGADGGDRKARKKVEKIARALGYSNDTNPFGDSNLLKPFVWGKKQQQDGVSGGGADTAETRLSLMKDIERVRERRKKREEELEEMERLRTEEVRLREAALYSDWQEKEEQFHMKQTEVRSAMRIVDSRLHPIDRIAQGILLIEAYRTIEADGVEKCLSIAQSLVSIDAQQSLDVVSALESDDLEEFIKDATDFVQLESTKRLHKSEPSAMFDDFWKSLLHVACGEKKKRLARRESAIHKSVDADIAALLDGKSMSDLCRLVQDIERSIQTGRETDTEYWHLMLEDIRLEIEKRRFVTAFVLMQKEQEEILAILAPQLAVAAAAAAASHSSAEDGVYTIDRSTIADDDAEVGDSDENMQASDEVVLQAKVYSWVDKYRPRKPRYLNRVRNFKKIEC